MVRLVSCQTAFFFALLLSLIATAAAAGETEDEFVAKFVQRHCTNCHGPEVQEGDLRLDSMLAEKATAEVGHATWQSVWRRLRRGDMPPEGEPRPNDAEVDRVLAWLGVQLMRVARVRSEFGDEDFPGQGNAVPHELLFPYGEQTSHVAAATASPRRIWRLSPYNYREQVDELTQGFVGILRGKIGSRGTPVVASPFGLTSEAEFRDYAFRYRVGGPEIEQLALNAKMTVELMLQQRGPRKPPRDLSTIAESETGPTDEQIRAAVATMFGKVLRREPREDELRRYTAFARENIERLGSRKGLVLGMAAVLMHPEAVFRLELGRGQPDEHGRVTLAPLELAHAISFGLTDRRPDDFLMQAVRDGKLLSRQDVQREVLRILDDEQIPKPRILRFFQEYFGYTAAPSVFKDDYVLRDAGFMKYYPERLVEDTDRLVLHILEQDRDVLRELLTTELSFVDVASVPNWVKFANRRAEQARAKGETPPAHPFDKKNKVNEHYNFDPADWRGEMPLPLDPRQRAGILTQPSWLIAHSTNTDNHAIHRGKWIQERLLGGLIPDTPITVAAQLPDEPHETLRHRMRVTREAYCWKCHERMDPLGLPLEMFDHFGRHRTEGLGRPVDTSGAILDSGDERIDGPVGDGLEMIRRLAESPRVRQVFVRHAFRYWMGRNETVADAATLQAADRAYVESGGGMRSLIASLMTSDAFLYRTSPESDGTTPDATAESEAGSKP
ncbi:MAG: DUF1588 domain-containing protein [Pirellulaceae bacterium]